MTIQTIYVSDGTLGFDMVQFLTDSQINTMWTGSPFYVAMVDVASQTVSSCAAYINKLLDKGFKVGLYRGYFNGMFDGGNAASNGTAHAQKLIDVAEAVGTPQIGPPFLILWCDIEGQTGSTTKQNVKDYVTAFSNKVNVTNGVTPGTYIGANPYMTLTGADLDSWPITSFWKPCSTSVNPNVGAGWKIIQTCCNGSSCDYSGIAIDRDQFQTNAYGGKAGLLSR